VQLWLEVCLFAISLGRRKKTNAGVSFPAVWFPAGCGLVSERGAGDSITCHIAAKPNKAQRYTSSGSACPGPSRRTGSFHAAFMAFSYGNG